MQAVILVGGRGERLMPLTDSLPKPMLLVAGKPVLWHQIMLLKKHGIRDMIICGHYLFSKIRDCFGSGKELGVSIVYVDEPQPLGTGGAVKNAQRWINGDFVLLYGDVVTDLDITKLVEFHKKNLAAATLVLRKTDHPKDSDIVQIDKNNRVIKLFPKPHPDNVGDLGNTSLFALSRQILDHIPDRPCNLEHDVIAGLVSSLPIYGYVSADYIRDMGTPERLEKVRKDVESGAVKWQL